MNSCLSSASIFFRQPCTDLLGSFPGYRKFLALGLGLQSTGRSSGSLHSRAPLLALDICEPEPWPVVVVVSKYNRYNLSRPSRVSLVLAATPQVSGALLSFCLFQSNGSARLSSSFFSFKALSNDAKLNKEIEVGASSSTAEINSRKFLQKSHDLVFV